MIDFEKRAMTEYEDKYTFRQSAQICSQSGLIGYLRADMDKDGNGFFSTWSGWRDDLKTPEFQEEFDGVISSVMDFGVFVMLENTCEGLLAVEELGEGLFATTSFISLKNMTNGNEYRVGQPIRVKVKNANVI